ncbi:hypothetical protein WJX82_005261 [Trebouxia sp. C0006]
MDHKSWFVILDAVKSKTGSKVVPSSRIQPLPIFEKPCEQILRPGITYEEQPIFDQADIQHLLVDIEHHASLFRARAC